MCMTAMGHGERGSGGSSGPRGIRLCTCVFAELLRVM